MQIRCTTRLEDEIIPMYYDSRSADNLPVDWIAREKECIRTLAPQFCTRRMVKEYMDDLYAPAMKAGAQNSESRTCKGAVHDPWNGLQIRWYGLASPAAWGNMFLIFFLARVGYGLRYPADVVCSARQEKTSLVSRIFPISDLCGCHQLSPHPSG